MGNPSLRLSEVLAPLKAVLGVDRLMKAPSMHKQKPYQGKFSKFSQQSFCQKQISEPNSIMHKLSVSALYRQSIKLFHQKLL